MKFSDQIGTIVFSLLPSTILASYHNPNYIEAPTSLHPVTPNPNPFQVTYEDGTESPPLYVQMIYSMAGDLTSSSPLIFEEDVSGFTVERSHSDGKYMYVDVDDATGEFVKTGLIVGVDNPVVSGLQTNAAEKKHAIQSSLQSGDDSNTPLHESTSESPPRKLLITRGQLKNLVVPFKFSNHASRTLPSQSDLDILLNNNGPNTLCPTGSVRDVFLKNSLGQPLQLDSTIAPWVTIDHNESYCANGKHGLTPRFHKCLRNALDKVVNLGYNFSNFDMNNDGIIDGITFIHSGYGAEWGEGHSDRIWSHKWHLSKEWSNNGVRVYEYQVAPALWSTSGSDIGRIGLIAHETGHLLGLPDLYDSSSTEADGIGSYGLMANAWGFDNSQYYPPHMSAWTKLKLNWATPTVVTTSGRYSLRQACNNTDVIKISTGYPSGEYLLIENRQPCEFDAKIPQGGLAIFHIDMNVEGNDGTRGYPYQNGWPRNGKHYMVALLQADAYYDLEKMRRNRGDRTDLFHAGYVNSIGPYGITGVVTEAHPNTKAYQGGNIIATGIQITNIGKAHSTMTFDIIIPVSPTNEPNNEPTDGPISFHPPTTSPAPTSSVSPTDEPTTFFPTILRTDEPTNRDCSFRNKLKCNKQGCVWKSVGDDAGVCITCSTVNKPSFCKRKGCDFTNKPRPGARKCSACYESLNRRQCLNNGCVWEGKAKDGTCKSCNQFRVKYRCSRGGCAFKPSVNVNKPGKCFACDQISTSKECKQQEEGCVWNIHRGECLRNHLRMEGIDKA